MSRAPEPSPGEAALRPDTARLYRTDEVQANLRRRSVRSGATTVVARGTQLLLQLGSAMVLARLLTPGDFGVQAMVAPIALLANTIANQSIQAAIIQREQLDDDVTSAVFWHAVRFNVVVLVAMLVAAPLFGRFYREPRVVGVMMVWAFVVYAAALASVHDALLKRQMRFGTVVRIQVSSLALSLIAGIVAALLGAGYWALIIQVVASEGIRAAALWWVSSWRPRPFASRHAGREGLRGIRTFWANLSAARLIGWAGDQLDRVVMGTVGGAAMAGLYDSAKRWATFPIFELWSATSDVAVSSLSRARADAAMYRSHARHAFLPILSVAYPAIAFMFVEARSVLRLLLGPQWVGATPFVRLLCVAAAVGGIGRLMQWVYLSTGETARQLRFALVSTPVMFVALLAGARWGAMGVAYGYVAGIAVLAVPNAFNALRGTPVSPADCAAVFARPAVAAIAAALLLALLDSRLATPGSVAGGLALRLPLFGVIYAALWVALPGGRSAFGDILSGARELRASPTPPERLSDTVVAPVA